MNLTTSSVSSGIAGQLIKAWIGLKFRQVGVTAEFLQEFGGCFGQRIQGAASETQCLKSEHGAADDLAIAGGDMQGLSDLLVSTRVVTKAGREVADKSAGGAV